MDIVLRQMILSHQRWLFACRFVFGLDQGSAVYLATARFMTLPSNTDQRG